MAVLIQAPILFNLLAIISKMERKIRGEHIVLESKRGRFLMGIIILVLSM